MIHVGRRRPPVATAGVPWRGLIRDDRASLKPARGAGRRLLPVRLEQTRCPARRASRRFAESASPGLTTVVAAHRLFHRAVRTDRAGCSAPATAAAASSAGSRGLLGRGRCRAFVDEEVRGEGLVQRSRPWRGLTRPTRWLPVAVRPGPRGSGMRGTSRPWRSVSRRANSSAVSDHLPLAAFHFRAARPAVKPCWPRRPLR